MLQKTILLGACLVAVIGCAVQTPSSPQLESQHSNNPTSGDKVQTESQSQRQEQIRQEAERERENQRQIALSQIRQLEQQSNLLAQRMLGRQQKISNLELEKNQLATEIRTYTQKVESFILKHKNAVACMGAAGASLDESNQFSKDVKDVANAVTFICGVAVLSNEEFRKEIFFVLDQLTQADNRIKNLRNSLQTVQAQLDAENQVLAQEQSTVRQLSLDIQNHQSQLAPVPQREI